MPETVIIYNPSLKSRAGYLASALFTVCVLLLCFYLVSIVKGSFVLNFDTDKQIVTIICILYFVFSLFTKHLSDISFDYQTKTVTISVLRVLSGYADYVIPFDDFYYYEENRRILRFRDRIFFYRKKKELVGVPKRHLPADARHELATALREIEKLYPDEA
ncbi:hypothetical protein MKQ68_05530 [Chitinophaga horti]|uniref:PH domain-containing protein n=1 Tax=Chitinophaga horti TaxID=2920382 RepID=A0ABY6J4F2_9BACT|nr:hypothetical protein [Chitinophaga horti]UYQ94551.1 hypothetical protein MKQ68_05530 [Chitinophaga horti]